MQIVDAFESFLTHGRSERLHAIETQKKYRDCFTSWILPRLGHVPIEAISRLDILNFRQLLVERGLSVSRQCSILIVLKSFLRFCRTVLKVDCLDPAEIALPNRGRPHVLVLTDVEIRKMLDATLVHTFAGLRLRALIELILATGVRISEALSLNRSSFDQNHSEIAIIGKGKKPRTIFLNVRAKHWVGRYLQTRFDDDPAVFVTTGSMPSRWKREDVSRFFINLSRRAALGKKITPHILRHTYCTNLLKNGADITFIKDLAGHQDIHTTEKYYLKRDDSLLRSVAERFVHYNLDE
jgi:integrase/recombinase XerD